MGKLLYLRPYLQGSIAKVESWLHNKIDEHYDKVGDILEDVDDLFCIHCKEFKGDAYDECMYCDLEDI